MNKITKYLLTALSLTLASTAFARESQKSSSSSSTLGRESLYFEALVNAGLHQKNKIEGEVVPSNVDLEAKYKALFGGQGEIGMTQDSFRLGLNFSYLRANGKEFVATTTSGEGDDQTTEDVTLDKDKYRRDFYSYTLKGYYDMALSQDVDAFIGAAIGASTVRTGILPLEAYGVSTEESFTKTLFTWGLNAGLVWHASERVDLVARYDFQYIPSYDIKEVKAHFNRTLLHSFGFGLRFHL